MLVVRSVTKRRAALHGAALGSVRSQHTNDGSHLREAVRKFDYDHYVCGLLFPQDKRSSFFAIRAMNAELASVKDSIRSNPATGKIRMQWWRENIYNLYSPRATRAVPETMLLRALSKAIDDHELTRRWFERLLDARDEDLDTDQPHTLHELEVYADKTAASLLYLTLECLGVRDGAADRAAGHAGVAVGLTTLLRGTPYHLAHNQLYLPEDLLLKHDLTNEHFEAASQDPAEGKKLAPVVFEVACLALEHLRASRELTRDVPKEARPALLSVVSSSMYLEQLERVNFNVFDPSLMQRSPMQLHLQVLKNYFLRKY
ncbi:hypothetical protein Poli38472_002857 [Pythium oligandrum]|uniref:15-cis-phytoene synthase n=1 Tax=Pythium oligandrum TaxID=41045 RepID=A0A8K1C5K0_PYTOL|nr:hypothetical protein Poli38472_002857 [Pythium oligandrum]|eukprot:TMW56932.1 hypothetical protein Poli38472_002857 [Pythium oligandrum]